MLIYLIYILSWNKKFEFVSRFSIKYLLWLEINRAFKTLYLTGQSK